MRTCSRTLAPGCASARPGADLRQRRRRRRRCTVYRPDIGALLPVYVADRYEGIAGAHVRRLQRRGGRRATSTRTSPPCARCVGPRASRRGARQPPGDGPGDPRARARRGGAVRRQGPRQRARVHGQAQPERFLGLAREGLAGARAVLVGSHHTAASLWDALGRRRARAAHPPGPAGRRRRALRAARPARRAGFASPRGCGRCRSGAGALPPRPALSQSTPAAGSLRRAGRVRARRRSPRRRRCERLDPEHDRLVAFVGKLIVSKGVDLLLAAWPLVLERVPRRAPGGRRLRRLPRPASSACSRALSARRPRAARARSRWRAGRSRLRCRCDARACPPAVARGPPRRSGRCAICSRSSTACRAPSASAI